MAHVRVCGILGGMFWWVACRRNEMCDNYRQRGVEVMTWGFNVGAFPCVWQSSGRPCSTPFSSAGLAHGIGGGSGLPSRYPSLSVPVPVPVLRRSNPMLPPTPVSVPQAQCNPLEEPSPLGLTLKKTPSLLDLITFQLQNNANAQAAESENSAQGLGKSRIGKCLAPTGSAAQDKLKASNFPASTLKIGTWEVGVFGVMRIAESRSVCFTLRSSGGGRCMLCGI